MRFEVLLYTIVLVRFEVFARVSSIRLHIVLLHFRLLWSGQNSRFSISGSFLVNLLNFMRCEVGLILTSIEPYIQNHDSEGKAWSEGSLAE